MKELLEFIAQSILDHPDDISVSEEVDPEYNAVRLTLEVHSEDMGKAIGKNGKVARAIKNLIKVKALQQGKKFYLDIVEKNSKRKTHPEVEHGSLQGSPGTEVHSGSGQSANLPRRSPT